MKTRLEVSLVGTQYSVGMLHLDRDMIKAGMETYGPRKWNSLVNEIALDKHSGKLISEINHTIGHTLKVVYRGTGIAMRGTGFGMEVFHGGDYFPVEMVEAKNRTLHPSELMEGYKSKDMLGVFWARRESAMLFRWENVDTPRQEEISLAYDDLGPMLARKRPFEIAQNVTWQGHQGQHIEIGRSGPYETLKHVFHMVK